MTVNKQAIIRLSKYKSALNKLRALGFKKVYSDNLADSAGVTSAQVRKDFSMFEITGNKRGGYNVDDLLNKLNFVLGKDKIYDIIIVGVGNIGAALLKYKGFEKEGLRIVAGFDIDSLKINRELPVPILPIEEMSDFVKKNKIKIAIIATPELAAQEVLDELIKVGVKGFLNFTPIRLKAPENIVINNVDIYAEIEKIIYFISAIEKSKDSKLENKKLENIDLEDE